MCELNKYVELLTQQLVKASTTQKAKASRHYFPNGINCIGANAQDIKLIIFDFHKNNALLTPEEVLSLTELLLKKAKFHEEKLIAFGLINKFVKKHYDDNLMKRFEYWLENYAQNWSQVDDLCIKTIYNFLLAHPHLIEKTQHWAYSNSSWCRRASNVVWVKFISRKIGSSVYYLNINLVFKNCDLLMHDKDEFVQKSIGWLLKVTSLHHEKEVINFIKKNITKMTRPTLRYAIEKMESSLRKKILLLKI